MGLVGARDEGAAAAVFEDVGELLGREARADRGVVEAGVVGAPGDREHSRRRGPDPRPGPRHQRGPRARLDRRGGS